MKYSIAILLLALSATFIACEKDEDDSNNSGTNTIMPPTTSNPSDTTAVSDSIPTNDPEPTFDFTQDFQNKREAFVGIISRNTCGICGRSGHPTFDDHLIQNKEASGVSFNYSQSDPLYHPESNEYASIMRLQGTPSFTIGFNNYRNNPSTWKTEIANFESQTADAHLAMAGKPISTGFQIQVKAAIHNNTTQNTPHLAVYVLENNVISPQTDYGATPTLVQDYIHNHVFRGSATGLLGESIADVWSTGDTITKTYDIDASKITNLDNAYFVAILMELDSSGNPVGVINSQQLYK
jgi:hypothetical protein